MSLLGIDIGTTGCKAAAFSHAGQCLAGAYREYATRHPAEGWAEVDSGEVWEKVRTVIREVASRTAGDPVTALCTSSMGESFVPVSGARQILGDSILCADPRGGPYVAALERDFPQEAFYAINPNILGTQYSLPKLLWLRDHQPELFERAAYFLLWGDLLGFLLGCEPVTSYSLANRTLLFDIRRADWSDRLLEWSGIPRRKLGRAVPGGTVIGAVSDAAAADLGLPRGVTVVTGGHDQCCNSLGAGICGAGRAVCGIGSYECLTPTYDRIPAAASMLANGLNVEHHVLPGLYVSFIYNQGGTLVKWFRNTFAAADAEGLGRGEDIYGVLNAEMPPDPTRLLVLPYFEKTGPPHFVADAAGAIVGLRTGTTRGEILKAVMECETFYFVDSIDALRGMGIDTSEFVATGGGARSDQWLQIKADIFGVPFVRPGITDGSVLGAALLAGLATGVFGSPGEAVPVFVRRERVFEPDAARHARYQHKLVSYRALLPALHELLRSL